jgi:hypothetical protein
MVGPRQRLAFHRSADLDDGIGDRVDRAGDLLQL